MPSDKSVLKNLIEDINVKISASKDNERYCYSVSQVIAAVQRSNINKSDIGVYVQPSKEWPTYFICSFIFNL